MLFWNQVSLTQTRLKVCLFHNRLKITPPSFRALKKIPQIKVQSQNHQNPHQRTRLQKRVTVSQMRLMGLILWLKPEMTAWAVRRMFERAGFKRLQVVDKVLSAEDNSSAEVKGETEHLSSELPEKLPTLSPSTGTIFKLKTGSAQGQTTNLPLVGSPTDSSDTTSDSADTSDMTGVTAATSDSSESTSSESDETSESNDTSDASKSTEDSNGSDSAELEQIKTKDCVNGTQSCESEEYFFQDIGDDAHYSVDNLMVPDEDERELSLRR
ncbi:dentin sialophosphoprotein [Lates calcarifer]|uniref:Dentin sialophosphoprotein n=1 Tax=Lates calcarifer TaxID=8187 RepID=A0AAJ7QAT7_LATCA|nr:dentin sialophosphoprotein [Lates calcarifer]